MSESREAEFLRIFDKVHKESRERLSALFDEDDYDPSLTQKVKHKCLTEIWLRYGWPVPSDKDEVWSYVEKGGTVCPSCGCADGVDLIGLKMAGQEIRLTTRGTVNSIYQSVVCGGCEATWTEVYRLSGFCNLRKGTDGGD